MTKIKICGLRRIEDIQFANLAKPDYVGFIFADSKRKVTIQQAAVLKAELHEDIQAAGVFVNAPVAEIANIINQGIIDLIQLHGDEDERYIVELQMHTNLPIIKAVRMKNPDAITEVAHLPVDYFLLDTYSKQMYGGTGHTFDWTMVSETNKPFFLAGGLQVDNIVEAIQKVGPFCVDVSSGVETDGVKDKMKMIEIVNRVRGVGK